MEARGTSHRPIGVAPTTENIESKTKQKAKISVNKNNNKNGQGYTAHGSLLCTIPKSTSQTIEVNWCFPMSYTTVSTDVFVALTAIRGWISMV